MSEEPQREWRFNIDDMIACAERAISYTEGMDQERFVASGLNYDASIRNLELIGEVATHVPEAVRHAYPEIPKYKGLKFPSRFSPVTKESPLTC